MHRPSSVLVVGASVAGVNVARELRREGFEGAITLLGDERHLPYNRPPLSKQILKGEWDDNRAFLIDDVEASALAVDIKRGDAATSLDVMSRQVTTAAGNRYGADAVVLATGCSARTIPATAPYETLRTLDDAMAIRTQMQPGVRLAVIGGGFLGSELAAAASDTGADVTLISGRSVPMAREIGLSAADVVQEMHLEHGVNVFVGDRATCVASVGGGRAGVWLTSGRAIPADLVVVAIGTEPNVDWLRGSGLHVVDGVRCDEHGVAAPGIYALGDVANRYSPRYREHVRIEHQLNAIEQSSGIARSINGHREPCDPLPYWWSDQYGVRMQAYGRLSTASHTAYIAGHPRDRRFTCLFGDDTKVSGVLAWNSARSVREARTIVAHELSWREIDGDVTITRTRTNR